MEEYIAISTLNDFIFCPYSIYLHNVYMNMDEDLYHAVPQARGKSAHASIDHKKDTNKNRILSLPVYSEKLGLAGKIDVYNSEKKILVERKYQLKQIYQGQIYQLWAQYFCMIEMGYQIDQLAFYEISSNTMFYQDLPTEIQYSELSCFVEKFRSYNPLDVITVNQNKCRHCIYCNLCDKTQEENVY